MTINSATALASVATPADDVLFGIEVVPDAVGAGIPDGTEVEVNTTSMFALMNARISFRIKFEITAGEVFKKLVIDVASNYDMPEEYSITNQAFIDFANIIVVPHIRSYAQTVLNGILVEAKLPPRILPQMEGTGNDTFTGKKLPEVLSSESMTGLKDNPELAVN